jgi:hypothetical protein
MVRHARLPMVSLRVERYRRAIIIGRATFLRYGAERLVQRRRACARCSSPTTNSTLEAQTPSPTSSLTPAALHTLHHAVEPKHVRRRVTSESVGTLSSNLLHLDLHTRLETACARTAGRGAPIMYCNEHQRLECDSCRADRQHALASTHSRHPDYCGYDLCRACRAEFDSRMGFNMRLGLLIRWLTLKRGLKG